MDQSITQRLTRKDIWIRALFMVLFVIAYGVAEIVLTLLVLFQFFAILFTGKANAPLLRLGTNVSAYIYEILQFMTFNSEQRPFPFSDWPDDEPAGEQWLEDPQPAPEPEIETASAPAAPTPPPAPPASPTPTEAATPPAAADSPGQETGPETAAEDDQPKR